jgi:hypothetical protein
VLGGVDGNLHFPVTSINRLNQTESATFSILLYWAFFRDSVFLYFILQSKIYLRRLKVTKYIYHTKQHQQRICIHSTLWNKIIIILVRTGHYHIGFIHAITMLMYRLYILWNVALQKFWYYLSYSFFNCYTFSHLYLFQNIHIPDMSYFFYIVHNSTHYTNTLKWRSILIYDLVFRFNRVFFWISKYLIKILYCLCIYVNVYNWEINIF